MALSYKFISLSSIFFFFLLLFSVDVNGQNQAIGVFNVKDYGAVANGEHDDTEAFDGAWRDACAAEGEAKVSVPEGSYNVGPMTFQGPCNGSMTMEVKGVLLAPTNLSLFTPYTPEKSPATWLQFRHLNNFLLYGDAVFDGQGHSAWPLPYSQRPYALGFRYVSNGTVRGISVVNSKSLHLLVYECSNFIVDYLTVNSPADSPNTDGVHIALSTQIVVANSTIGSGDDCIAFLEGAANVNVSNVTCGPGHGISVGSLGSFPQEKDVVNLTISNCTFFGTDNGLRIKTWQSSPSISYASNILFHNISMSNVSNPIIIDQQYCPLGNCNTTTPSKVKISSVQFRNIQGTYRNTVAMKLVCSKDYPCSDVELGNIDLEYIGKKHPEPNLCVNVSGNSTGTVQPPSCI